ncbi:MAG: monovalent cation/H+ antiporter complex subunit F [Butyricicoccus sp.]|nr:monovalent cation/H+ antiporter complex subunit F [Butyricicoccus sp.]
MEKTLLLAVLLAMAALILAALVRAVLGPHFTDRVVAVNAVNTMVTACICLLSRYLEADYLIDVALIYALLGFTANVLLMRLIRAGRRKEGKK